MKFGIFGDIHSNLEGLEAVLEDMQKQKVTHAVCLGDIVGYNANPSECLELVRALGCPIVKGNHDEEASEERDIEHFNPLAYASMKYSREALSDEQKKFLRSIPFQKSVSDFTIVHSTLDGPARWQYVFTAADAEASFTYQRTQACFFGHTHVPHLFVRDTMVHEFFYKRVVLQPDKRYFVNVGSVGQPRDGDWRAAYVIYDSKERTIELRRVPYDLAKAQSKIMSVGLPDRLAERLANAV
ncbi:MAG: metallophosphoesterase family protein [Blastochloris sp.]|nr:metallophosphoesterase family protein [Blastochloris sp.]